MRWCIIAKFGFRSGSFIVVFLLLLVSMAVAAGAVAARFALMWWARQPIGVVHIDQRASLRVGARLMDASGRCDGDGELVVEDGRIRVTMGDATVLWQPVVAVEGAVSTQPRPAVRLSGEGWSLLVVVDRARPVPVAVGQIGRLRQTTTAQLVIDAIGEVAPSDHADVT